MTWTIPLAIALGSCALAAAGTALLLPFLRRRGVIDHPNERSSHRVATPRGGGLAVSLAVCASWLAVRLTVPELPVALELPVAAGFALALLSFLEDVRGIRVFLRLLLQAAAVALGLLALADDRLVFQGALPLALDRLLSGLIWLWFVNLYNFMDGIDGISVVETAALALGTGFAALAVLIEPHGLALAALALGAAALGFLPWNWHPAKIFLGDAGSVPLGYFAGFLLLWLAAQGLWAAALILPAYYLADATTTLFARLLRGAPVWHAHREHAYQRAVQRGLSHAQVSLLVALVNLGLVLLALVSLAGGARTWAALGAAAVLALSFLWYLRRPGIPAGNAR